MAYTTKMTKPTDYTFKMLEAYGRYEETHIRPDTQDREGKAWQKLLELIEQAAQEQWTEFQPAKHLGWKLWQQITVLPNEIGKLTKVKGLYLYGSRLQRIPPQIGNLTALEDFDPYTSYNLHWFPYEITRCKKLKDSRVSTRAIYGNYKYRSNFPDIRQNPVNYHNQQTTCSVCGNTTPQSGGFKQFWISLWVGTDVLPLLANICSDQCLQALPKPPADYVAHPHQGGAKQAQPLSEMQKLKDEYGGNFHYY